MPGKRLLEENELFKTAWIEFVRYGRMDRESLRPSLPTLGLEAGGIKLTRFVGRDM